MGVDIQGKKSLLGAVRNDFGGRRKNKKKIEKFFTRSR